MGMLNFNATGSFDGDDPLFSRIASDLTERSFSVVPNALPHDLATALFTRIQGMHRQEFNPAGVGRAEDHTLNQFVRRDCIRWIGDGASDAEQAWLTWADSLQQALNRQLFLGLLEFESHFAHYAPGDFYRRHVDAFKPEVLATGPAAKTNRILSVVAYFNPGWLPDDGGELVIYHPERNETLLKVTPAFGTLAVFLSEVIPHEVLPARRDRYSIAGWFRS